MENRTRREAIFGAVASATALTISPLILLAQAPVVHEIEIKRFKFDPEVIEVKLGDIIRWTNEDLAPHTATADNLGWDTERLNKGDSAEVSVVEGMETSYFCTFHPHMRGVISIS